MFSGSIKSDSHIFNANKEREERVGQVYFLLGKSSGSDGFGWRGRYRRGSEAAGDLDRRHAVREGQADHAARRSTFPAPVYSLSVKAKTKADEDKLGPGLQKLAEEDPTFHTVREQWTPARR